MSKRKVKELLEELDERIEKVQSSEEFKEYLQFFSRFHDYSYRNILLIKMQKPNAKLVAGFKQWQKKFNRYVKKGEEGIMILAPYKYKKQVTELKKELVDGNVIEKEVEKEKQFVSFKPVYVFDVSQTEGEPVPALDTSIKDKNINILDSLIRMADNLNIGVEFKPLRKGLKGFSKGGDVVVDEALNNTEKAAVLVHEVAHELLHYEREDNSHLTKEIMELEAETVAYIVMDRFGIEIESDKYLALYKKSYNLIDSFQRINKVINLILQKI